MELNSNAARAAGLLPLIGIVLALANWNTRPAAAWAWAGAILMFVVMIVARRYFQLAASRSPGNVASVRGLGSVNSAVVSGALIMIVPLAVTLAHAYGLVDDPDSGKRATMAIIGAYLVAMGNGMPRLLSPVSSMQTDGARNQAFLRLAGRTWVLGGLGWVIAWLALPIDAAGAVSMTAVAAALISTVVQLFRFRKPRQHAPALD